MKTIKQINEFSEHALANICCSGNKAWSAAAMKEWGRRKKQKKTAK